MTDEPLSGSLIYQRKPSGWVEGCNWASSGAHPLWRSFLLRRIMSDPNHAKTIYIDPTLASAIDDKIHETRPSSFEIETGLSEDKMLSHEDIVKRAVVTYRALEKMRNQGHLWVPVVLEDGSFIWFADIDEQAERQFPSGVTPEPRTPLELGSELADVVEALADQSSVSADEMVYRSLARYFAIATLIEERGGLGMNPGGSPDPTQ